MLGEAMVRLGAALSHVLLYQICPRRVLGPQADYWDVLRYRSIGVTSRLLGWAVHTDRPIRDEEFAGVFPAPPEEVERVLWKRGFHRNPVAAVKTRKGTPEIGSWVRRADSRARRQLHVMLFRRSDGRRGVDVYAHEEFSCLNPAVAVRHYRGIDQRAAVGVRRARELLPLVQPGDGGGVD
ncbi:hypothetical protein [Halobellus ruber]|uniref:Uncharacterized protein n=1 Tax=Halobellus ruber TaxID=2761102 RepID=A0A7J9SND5_9EURY|nr:hypothetical protein [Halobellus ruber]MBB6647729.1 hypothetical protein [Halobellus ruber]